MYDVIVVGGGPVGSQVAYRLSMAGRKVAVMEQKADLREPLCCTGIVGEECVRAYEIDEAVIYRHVSSARIFSPSAKEIYLRRDQPQAAILNRPAFNAFMASRARTHGAEYFVGTRVTDIKVGHDHVEIASGDGSVQNVLSASAVVIATGFVPGPRQNAAPGKAGDFVGGAQAEVQTSNVEEIEVYLGEEFAPRLFAWLVPTSPGKALAGLLSRRTPKEYLKTFLTFLANRAKITPAEVRVEVGSVPLRPAARTYDDRLLVVGTAAGQVKPTTGGGIYYGLLCADIAAGTLNQVLGTGDLSRQSMATYERRWKTVLGDEIKAGRQARTAYQWLGDRQLDHVFDIMQRHGVVEGLLREPDVSFDWHSRAIRHLLGQRSLAKLSKGAGAFFQMDRSNKRTHEETEQ